jgi:hypothetical protein
MIDLGESSRGFYLSCSSLEMYSFKESSSFYLRMKSQSSKDLCYDQLKYIYIYITSCYLEFSYLNSMNPSSIQNCSMKTFSFTSLIFKSLQLLSRIS